jgi:hypothetical protein
MSVCVHCGEVNCNNSCYYHDYADDLDWYEPDPFDMYEQLVSDFHKNTMTEAKFIELATALGLVDNFDIIKVIQDKKEAKQKDLTNDQKSDIL